MVGSKKHKRKLKGNRLRPKKGLGQHFLLRREAMNRIVALANLTKDDEVIEIGTGLGDLTILLAEKSHHVCTLEIDKELVERSAKRLRSYTNISLLHKDALHYDYGLHKTSDQGTLKIIGNLPFNISTQILLRLLDYPGAFARMVLMLQKEVVDRLAAKPATKDYGVLTLLVRPFYQVRREFVLPPEAFYPRPKVESAIALMNQRSKTEIEPAIFVLYKKVVKAVFNQRRKTLRNALVNAIDLSLDPEVWEELLISVGIDPSRRGETLGIDEFKKITMEIQGRISKGRSIGPVEKCP